MAQNNKKLVAVVTTMNIKTEVFHVDRFPTKSGETARRLAMLLRPNSRIHKVRFEWCDHFCK